MAETAKRILLVEENPSDVGMVVEQLGLYGAGEFEIQNTQSIQASLERLSLEHFDVILLDLFLPDACGLQGMGPLFGPSADLHHRFHRLL